MRHLHYGEEFAVARCSFFNIYYFSLKSGRYGKKTIAIHSGGGGGQGGKRLPHPVPPLLPLVSFVNCLPPRAFFQPTWLCCYY